MGQRIRVVPRDLWDWRDSMGSFNNLSIITNRFFIFKRQIKTLIFGRTRLNQGSYGRFLRTSSKLPSSVKNAGSADRGTACRRFPIPDVGRAEWLSRNSAACKPAAITRADVIEKMVLPARRGRFNLQLPDSFGHQPGNQPRKNWRQSLAFNALETIHLSFAKPDGMSINARRQPRSVQLPGVFLLGRPSFSNKALTDSLRR